MCYKIYYYQKTNKSWCKTTDACVRLLYFKDNFSLNVNQGDVLVFSYVGYSTQEITYNGQLS